MRKTLVCVSIIFMFLISLMLITPDAVYASPGATTYDSTPTAHVDSGITTSETDAYDGNNATYATVDRSTTGTFDVQNFTTFSAPLPNAPSAVDIKIRYSADAGSDDYYQVDYDLGSGNWVSLVAQTAAAASLATYTWSSVARPGGGSWTWNDLPNLRIRVTTERNRGGDGAYFYEYETWATIHYTKANMYVDPASQSVSANFTIDIKVDDAVDFYGWEFKLYYDTSIITCPGTSNVTEGALLSSGGSTFFNVLNASDAYNATHGLIWATCTLLGNVVGVSGSGIIASIGFMGDANGVSFLRLRDTKMTGYDQPSTTLYMIGHDSTDGTVTYSGAVPEFPLGAALEIALMGVIIYVWWRGRQKRPKKIFANTVPRPKTI